MGYLTASSGFCLLPIALVIQTEHSALRVCVCV